MLEIQPTVYQWEWILTFWVEQSFLHRRLLQSQPRISEWWRQGINLWWLSHQNGVKCRLSMHQVHWCHTPISCLKVASVVNRSLTALKMRSVIENHNNDNVLSKQRPLPMSPRRMQQISSWQTQCWFVVVGRAWISVRAKPCANFNLYMQRKVNS